jgi:putative peptidoglycan lipid II flippase
MGLALLRYPIISTIFEHGRFDSSSSQLTAIPLLYASAGLCALAALKIIVPGFYARQDTRTPVAAAAIAMIVNLSANLLLIKPLGVAGPAVAAVCAAWVNCLMLYLFLRKMLLSGHEKALIVSVFRSTASAIPAAALLYWTAGGIAWIGLALWERILTLFMLIILTAASYLAASWVMRCPEFFELAALFRVGVLRHKGERK